VSGPASTRWRRRALGWVAVVAVAGPVGSASALAIAPASAVAKAPAPALAVAPAPPPPRTPNPVADPAVARSTLGGTELARTDVAQGPGTAPLPGDGTAASWLVADSVSGTVLAARDAHGRYPPASVLKVLTAVTLIPRLDKAATYVVTPADAAVDGSRVGLEPGTAYSIQDLFTALLSVSGNDAAMALASAAGGLDPTLAAMTATARELQADDTVVRTPSGLDAPGQVTSAYDLALLGRAGLAIPDFAAYVAAPVATFLGRNGTRFHIDNHNRLLTRYPGAIGVKNGYTAAARASLVAAARRGDHGVIVTLLGAESDLWDEAARLLDWGFDAESRAAAGVGTLVAPRLAGALDSADRAAADTGVAGRPAAAPAPVRAATHGLRRPQPVTVVGTVAAITAIAGFTVVLVRRRRARPG
jgi:D-alanyl-D-alanine carboxypeptidase (penicillin-binding protein 5/6)